MRLKTPTSPHIHANVFVTTVMLRVLTALLPAVIAYVWFFGWGIIINFLIAVTTGLVTEGLMLKARQRPLLPFLSDGSVVVTALLLAFCLPPLTPWWITVTGMSFAIVVAKHLYGGLGYNPFNPAMVGYVVLLISFPKEMSTWLPPNILNDLQVGFSDTLSAIFTGKLPYFLTIDTVSMATPLDEIKTQIGLGETVEETVNHSALFGDFGGVGWEWIGNWIFLGGVWLIYRRVITWHVPVAMLGSIFAIASIFFLMDSDHYTSPMFHLFSGATLLGAFFIATDPVSGCTTKTGQLIYGAGVGMLTYIIRVWGGYPDGVGFAILIMNIAAPTIDYYTQPRVYGHSRSE
ncbi:MAG: electron transport complex subunit RsxD [Gammaproteobacteria bacterium]|nr:electron transport complex subunit RsxD [Gammaproteobacteria bacterium]MDH5803328.1 electron transport complex subunit RsxD [Gammaproteobacteria bacterium]